jgi:hypothetical protein
MIDNPQTDTKTSHNPLCRWRVMKDLETCLTCISIAEARKEMLDKCIAAVDTVPPIAQHVDDNGMISLVYDKGEILDALRALSANADSDRNVSERRLAKP